MNVVDAFFIHPVALEHARSALQVELDMLRDGIGKRKRSEWLAAQRDRLCTDASITVPMMLVPLLQALTTKDTIAILSFIENNLNTIGAGSTFRSLRNAQRRNGLPDNVFDQATVNGAILLLADDAEFCSTFSNLLLGLFENIDQSPAFAEMNESYARIAESNELETVKQQRLIQLASEQFPLLIDFVNFDVLEERTVAYIRGRLLDQSIMGSITALVRVTGAGIFEASAKDIVEANIIAYCQVVTAIVNGRILDLSVVKDQGVVQEQLIQPLKDPIVQSPRPIAQPTKDDGKLLLSIEETAATLDVTRMTINRLIKRGALTGVHVGRRHMVVRSSIFEYLDLPEGL